MGETPAPSWADFAAAFEIFRDPLICAGVGGLVYGSGLLVWETRIALRVLAEETEFLLRRPGRDRPETEGGARRPG